MHDLKLIGGIIRACGGKKPFRLELEHLGQPKEGDLLAMAALEKSLSKTHTLKRRLRIGTNKERWFFEPMRPSE